MPAFAGLRVGLYVGGQASAPGQGVLMTSTTVITDRDTLHKNPPDILLTNYKMLDYEPWLLRPRAAIPTSEEWCTCPPCTGPKVWSLIVWRLWRSIATLIATPMAVPSDSCCMLR